MSVELRTYVSDADGLRAEGNRPYRPGRATEGRSTNGHENRHPTNTNNQRLSRMRILTPETTVLER